MVGCDPGRVEAPLAGRDYPGTLREFNAWFPGDEACLRYLAGLRWPGGFLCATCGGGTAWRMSKGRNLRCAHCRTDSSVTAGTIFADTRLPLTIWFAAAWYLTGTKHGVSALGLQRLLGLGSYESAWSLLHKLRRAMIRPGREQLAGEIEVDETFVGPQAPGTLGRGGKKTIVAIAAEVRPRGACGRARLARIPDCSAPVLSGFLADVAVPGSLVYTDSWRGYDGLAAAGFAHHPTSIAASGDPAHVVMPRAHRIASLLKRWLLGTHQGAIRARQLDFYLDEFTFRFNRRSSQRRGLLFYRLLAQAMQLEPVPLVTIIGGRP
ncbi:MAG: IS1595 family transposase [Pseudonocardiaceae bacterium]